MLQMIFGKYSKDTMVVYDDYAYSLMEEEVSKRYLFRQDKDENGMIYRGLIGVDQVVLTFYRTRTVRVQSSGHNLWIQ